MLISKFELVIAAALLASAAAGPIQAQLPMAEGPTKERAQSDSERDLEERIANMRYLATLAEKRGVGRKKDPKLAVEELQGDFTRLQIVNKDLVLTTAKSSKLDLKLIARSAVEINWRAARLMSNLALPEPATAVQRPPLKPISDERQLRASITSLGSLIYWFTKNPMFKEVKVIEPQTAAKARTDLERIIELSLHMKSGAEQLRK
jgi:hypothetical protein